MKPRLPPRGRTAVARQPAPVQNMSEKLSLMADHRFTREEFTARVARLCNAMQEAGVAAMLIDDAEILAYYAGFERSVSDYRACIIPRSGEPLAVLRALDVAPFQEVSWFSAHLAFSDAEDAVEAVARGIRQLGLADAPIGFDSGSHSMSVHTYERLRAALPGARFVPLPGLPWELRLRKSPAEIALTRRAATIADMVVGEIAARAHAGSTERAWSAYAARRFVELGGTPGHVGPITSGRGWAFLHGHLHDTPLAEGDILHLELVPRFEGYSARLMRSIVIGRATEAQKRDAELLCALQDAQLAAMRPGARAAEVDAILRDGVLQSGLRDDYDNITGYTLGYYSQQPLRSSDFTRVFKPGVDWVLEEGMLFHMYTSARGFAFSETVLVTADGAERLTRIARRLFETVDNGAEAAIDRIAYKVLTADEADRMRREGQFVGSPIDLADGFIHMSTAAQLAETIEKHFAGQVGLVVATVDLASLGHAIRWEPSRGGQLFPHLYGALPTAAVVAWSPV